MKKLLALVLALVMTLSLCVTSNAAYSDAADVDYKEAVNVMSAVGVFEGADGKFSPKANLTREQAAKLIAYLDLGKTVAEALPAVKVFNDVEADRWSAKYVAYCADAGYIAGVGDGNFNPAGELTGYAFGKMLLCVLGYNANVEGFTGNSWTIKVAKLMESNDIADDVDLAASATLTREAAAQYCLNALKADMVDYETTGSTLAVNGATIDFGASKAEVKDNTKYDYRVEDADYDDDDDDTVLQLCEKLYKKDLKLLENGDGDDLGRACKEWFYEDFGEDDAIATVVEKADVTFVCDDEYDSLAEAYEEVLDKDDLDFGDEDYVVENGFELVPGTVVELFVSKKVVESAVLYAYSYDVIKDVDTDVSAADAKDDVTAYVEFEGELETMNDTDIPDFDAATYVEDAYIAYIMVDDEVVFTAVAETLETSVDTKKLADNYLTVGGTKYYLADNCAGDTTLDEVKTGKDNTYTLVLDENDYVIGIEEVEAAATKLDEVYYAVAGWEIESGDYSETVGKVQLVDLSGKTKIVTVENEDTEFEEGEMGIFVTISDKKAAKNSGYNYKANDGKYNLTEWTWQDDKKFDLVEADGTEFTKTMTRDNNGYRFNAKTSYILVGGMKGDLEVSTYEGGIKLNAEDMTVYYITEHAKVLVQYVVVVDGEEISTGTEFTKDLVFVKSVGEEGNDDYVLQDVYMADGSKTTLKVDADQEYNDLAFYKYAENEDGYYEFDDDVDELEVDDEDGVWDDETGVLLGVTVTELYDNELLTVEGENGTIYDIKVGGAKVVDTRSSSTIKDSAAYDREIKSLSTLDKVVDDDLAVTVYMNVSKDGVATIFITDVE